MKGIEKLLKKINKQDRQRLLGVTEKLIQGEEKGLNIRKVTDSDFYRLRSGRFRIIFHYDKKEIIIDSIKLRDKNTYRRL
ncbi:type II toxin-antitoxin system RelE/ParE family toxin [Patescibacteria group bacterium]|nr:type II toxin-antitoxin system RelE/ParE family toxin [Patescibacteria group bacterium]